MTSKRELDKSNPPAIMKSTTAARLDAIVRRHGGEPKATKSKRFYLPPVGRRDCPGQIELDVNSDGADPA